MSTSITSSPIGTRDHTVKPFFQNLDALRFLSFLAVFLFHTRLYDYIAHYTSNPVLLALSRVLCSGGWGVTFFFSLSGFLITWLLLTEIKKNGRVNVPAFYMRRVLRIWPLFALVAFTGIVLLPIGYRAIHQHLLFDYSVPLYVAFLSNFGVLALDPALNATRSFPLVMNITWSVSIEEQFYVVWPLFFLLSQRLRNYTPALFILISVAAALMIGNNADQLYYSSFTRIGEIAIGALAAAATFNYDKLLAGVTNLPRLPIALIYVLAFVVVYSSFYFTLQPLAIYALHMVGALLFSLIILEQNFAHRSLFKLGRLRPLGFLGRISYGLYMLHPIAMLITSVVLQRLLHRPSPVTEGPVYILAAFVLTIGLALTSYYAFEKPFLKLKDKFSFDRKKVLAP